MFSSKPTAVLYLKKNELDFYYGENLDSEVVKFPAGTIKNHKIENDDAFKEGIVEFFAKRNLKAQKAVLVLSQDVIFEETIPILEKEKEVEAAEKFLEGISLPKEDIGFKKLKATKETYLVATNKNFYLTTKEVVENQGWTIELVIPITLFVGLTHKDTLTSKEVKQILQNINLTKVGNFLTLKDQMQSVSKKDISVEPTSPGIFTKGYIAFLFVLTTIVAVSTFAAFASGIVPNPLTNLPNHLKNLSNPFIAATPSPQPKTDRPLDETPTVVPQIEASETSVQILNGSGTPGQAGRAQLLLEELELESIEVGNADTSDNTKTTVMYMSSAEDVADEIVTALKESFATVEKKQSNEELDFDIVITTGEEL